MVLGVCVTDGVTVRVGVTEGVTVLLGVTLRVGVIEGVTVVVGVGVGIGKHNKYPVRFTGALGTGR